jgi:hypothetical protein
MNTKKFYKYNENLVKIFFKCTANNIFICTKKSSKLMEQHALKNVNNCLNTNIYSYLETSGGQSSNLYLNFVHFFNTSVN